MKTNYIKIIITWADLPDRQEFNLMDFPNAYLRANSIQIIDIFDYTFGPDYGLKQVIFLNHSGEINLVDMIDFYTDKYSHEFGYMYTLAHHITIEVIKNNITIATYRKES